jgi:hypothetical protein
MREPHPNVNAFDIGKYERRVSGDENRVGILKRNCNVKGVIHGIVHNYGTVPFVFSIGQSNDNNIADAWGAVTFRVAASNVTSVTVPVGAIVEFTVEAATKDYLRLVGDSQNVSSGRVVMANWWDEFEVKESEKVL